MKAVTCCRQQREKTADPGQRRTPEGSVWGDSPYIQAKFQGIATKHSVPKKSDLRSDVNQFPAVWKQPYSIPFFSLPFLWFTVQIGVGTLCFR